MEQSIYVIIRKLFTYNQVAFSPQQEEERFRTMSALETLGIKYATFYDFEKEFPFEIMLIESTEQAPSIEELEKFPQEIQVETEEEMVVPGVELVQSAEDFFKVFEEIPPVIRVVEEGKKEEKAAPVFKGLLNLSTNVMDTPTFEVGDNVKVFYPHNSFFHLRAGVLWEKVTDERYHVRYPNEGIIEVHPRFLRKV